MEVSSNTTASNAWMSRRITLSDIIHTVVFLGIFFIPFSSFNGIDGLGEYKKEPAALFFITAFVLMIIGAVKTKKINIPYRNLMFQLVMLLIGWFLFSTLVNAGNISEYYFKQTSGSKRFMRQFISLLLSSVVFLLVYYNTFRYYDSVALFRKIRRVMTYSLIVVTAYAILETAIIKLGFFPAYSVLYYFEYFPFTNVSLDSNLGRISSVTFEPPALATYIFSIAGWMFSYIMTEKGPFRYVPALVVIVLAFLSGSRAGLVVIVVQILAFIFLLMKKRRFHAVLIKILLAAMGLLLFIGIVKGRTIAEYLIEKTASITVTEGSHAVSNKSRYGIQYALFQVFVENPLIGVGYGQQTYEAMHHYPKWATNDNWEFRHKYLNEDVRNFPPGYNIYARILAESGIIGMLIFVSLLVLILMTTLRLIRLNNRDMICLMAIFVTMLGLYFNWLKTDTFRLFGFWINLAILIKIMGRTKYILSNSKPEE